MAKKQEVRKEEEIKDYFSLHIFLLKWSGIRLEPFEKNTHIAKQIFVVIASVTFVLVFPFMYVIDEALEAPNLELEELTYNLSYCITHTLGRYTPINLVINFTRDFCRLDQDSYIYV